MPSSRPEFLNDQSIRAALSQAWQASQAGTSSGHEEGGFILRDDSGQLFVERWDKGVQDTISLPPHGDCKVSGHEIVASFHTHPNTGSDYLQEPSETDRRAVRDDPDLKGRFYEGELVISQEKIYLVERNGQVSEVGDTQEILVRA
ncbi:MAG: DUF4329 domain-containing protein [Chloroflexi bacterium]|nr:DUF4329 domain-containing protein [Chloroflexota bacterium]